MKFAAMIAIFLLADASVSALDSGKLARHRNDALSSNIFDLEVEDYVPRRLDAVDVDLFFDLNSMSMSMSMSDPSVAPTDSPTDSLTGVPSDSPTDFPSDYPSKTPTKSPSPTPDIPNCINPITPFMRTDVKTGDESFLTCKIVNASPERWCDKGGATHCPLACGTCPTLGCEDSNVLFKTRFKNTLTCNFNSYKSGDVVRLCQDPNIRTACRSTCGWCQEI